jgi:Ser/Thr protein kinase RdoA (MazF antagonist)
VIVELVGPPGAGKSTLVEPVCAALRSCGIEAHEATALVDLLLARSWIGRLAGRRLATRRRSARSALVDVPYALRFALREPELAARAIAAIWQAPVSWRHRAVLLARVGTVAGRRDFLAQRLARRAAIFDEGLLHRAVNLFGWGDPSAADVCGYLRAVPPPGIAILVDTEDDAADRRIRRRGLPVRLRGQPTDRVDSFMRSAATIARSIPELSQERVRWLHLRNDGDVSAAAGLLRDRVPLLVDVGGAAAWPLFGQSGVVALRRPDRWYRNRPRSTHLSVADLEEPLGAWGIRRVHRARRVGSGRGVNLMLRTDAGEVLLKRYKPSLEDAAIANEHAVLVHLAAAGIPSVRLRSTPDGRRLVVSGSARYALFESISGHTPLHELVLSGRDRMRSTRQSGMALAILHRVLRDLRAPATTSSGLTERGDRALPSTWHAGRFDATGRADRAERLLELESLLQAADLRRGIVHGDFGPYNLLVRPGWPMVAVDFELSRADWRIVDLATALPRFAQSRLGFSDRRATLFLAGYEQIDPSLADELGWLPSVLEFLLLRRAAVCLDRLAAGQGDTWEAAAAKALREARSLERGEHPVARHLAAPPHARRGARALRGAP